MPQVQRAPRERPSLAARLLRGIGLSVCILLGLVLLLEIAGTFVPALSPGRLDPVSAELANSLVKPHPYLAYALRPGYQKDTRDKPGGKQASHNALGFRGPEITVEKPPGVQRVVCLGGSSTYGFGPTSDATTWPARLEALLNESAQAGAPRVQVINGGCQGYSTFESLINFAVRMVDLAPDLVLVYHAVNDMRCALYRTPVWDNTHWRAIWPVERPPAFERWIQGSTTFQLLRRLDPGWMAWRTNLASYVIVDFDPVLDAYAREELPEQGFHNYRRNLVSIASLARARGAQVAFVTQGMRYGDLEDRPSRDAQTRAMQRMLDEERAVGAELGVPVIEAAAVLEGEAARQKEQQGSDGVFTNEVHLTDAGADLLARTLASAIDAQALLKGRAAR